MISRFILLIAILLLMNGCTTLGLYKFVDFPCQNKTFKTKTKTVLVINGSSSMSESLYYITRNSLEDFEDNIQDSFRNNKNKRYYPQGSEFKIIGYYWPVAGGYLHPPSTLEHYLIQSTEDGNIAWISSSQFDYKKCEPDFYIYDTPSVEQNKLYIKYNKTYLREKIDLSKLDKQPFK